MSEKHINKNPIPCQSDSTKSPLPQHEGRLGVGIIPQGYKQTSIGTIPQDWEVVRLGEVCDFLKGKGISKENLTENGIPCIRYGELYTTYKEIIWKVISKTNLDSSELVFSKANDIILPTSGETAIDICKASCIMLNNVALGGDLNILRSKQNGAFLSYYINHIAKYNIAKLAQGVSIVHLYASELKSLQIPLPPLKEQEKIARILGVWDSAIDSLANLIKAKRKYKTALMQRLLTPPKDEKSTHPLAPSAREGEQESGNSTRGGGQEVSHRPLAPYMKEFSRAMRKNPTQAENKLWQELRGKKLGFGFRRQFVIDSKYIADFVCLEKRLIIECDGGQHSKSPCDSDSTKSPLPCGGDLGVGNDTLNHPDIQRDFYLESQNFRILRFWNNEILGNLEGVLCVIKEALESNGDFANAKYTCESTHPLAPSVREWEQEVSHHTNEGERESGDLASNGVVEKAPPLAGGVWGGVSTINKGECVESPRTNEGESHQSSLRFAGFSDKWQEFRLGDLLKEKNTRNTNNVNLVLSVTNKQGFVAQKDYFEQEVASNDTSNYKVVCRGEFAYNPARINVGSIAMLENFDKGILSPMYIVFECLEKINKDFFKYWLESHNFRGILGRYLSGSVRETLSFNDMKTMKIFIPTLAEQKKIAQVLSACDKEIETLNLKFECLKTQKKGLMQQLLSGKVRVKC